MKIIPDKLLITLLQKAVAECYSKDNYLIEQSMEQASVARVFYYMQTLINFDERFVYLKDYNLDCEYNKNGQHIKATPRCKNGTRPDMILHERGSNNHNILVVEFKSDNGSRGNRVNDIIKLEDFTSEYVYKYQLGVLVKLLKEESNYTFFKNGKILYTP